MSYVARTGFAFGLLIAASCVQGWVPDHSTDARLDAGYIPVTLDDARAERDTPWSEVVRLDAMRDTSIDGLDAPALVGDGASEDGWVLDCGGTVGRYGDGAMRAGSSAAFQSAYLRHYPQLGCPFDNSGKDAGQDGQYVHAVCGKVDVQDFRQPDSSKAISIDGYAMLILNPGLGEALLLHTQFWYAYACLRVTPQCEEGMGGSDLLGPPTDEKHFDGVAIRQDFAKGWMTLDANGSAVTIHLNEHRELDAGLLSQCGPENAGPQVQISNPVLPDGGIENGVRPPEVCAQPVALDNPKGTRGANAAMPTCSLNENGAVVLEYSDLECSDPTALFRGCEFAWDHDMRPFDPLQGNGGAYEVLLCVQGPVNGSVNIWYQQGDCDDCRYHLPLLSAGDALQGCRRIIVGPGDVNRNASWGPNRYCYARGTGGNACLDRLASGTLDASVLDASYSNGADAGSLADGGTGDAIQGRPDFSRSKLVLMNEWCVPGAPRPAAGSTVRIVLESVVYHPAHCLCTADQDCQQPALCHHLTWPAGACCECTRCLGVCS